MSDAAAPSSSGLLRRRWFPAALLAVLLLGALLLPSQLGISRYQRSITSVMARSIGRPVHLSGVDWRLLPTPAFILHDLTVSEDASFGAEPLLTARTVVASVSFYSLWRGHPVFSSIHVDQASLNLVRNDAGSWNLEALLATPAQQHLAASSASPRQPTLPYLEATESRLNLKFGTEKSPYSLVNSDLSFWQDQPGQWRIRLRGQPVRTDIAENTDAAQDSGEIRIDGSLQSAPTLRQMPVHLQLAWRDAQLGQLSLLLLGNDAGWRGNLTADLALTGTAEQASIQGRLRATSVHRAELGPVAPLDFDTNCGLVYQHTLRAIHQLHCDTGIADGHLLYAADLPPNPPAATEHPPAQQSVTLQRIPLQATLDLLRTLRSNFAPGLSATGVLDGTLRLQPPAAPPSPRHEHARERPANHSVRHATDNSVWSGSITLTGGKISGNSLAHPWSLARLTLQPDPSGALAATIPLPVCAGKTTSATTSAASTATGTIAATHKASLAAPAISAANSGDCSAALAITRSGYQIRLTGNASIPRLVRFTAALGLPLPLPDGFQGGSAEMQMQAIGPWIMTQPAALTDHLTGSLRLRAARWSHPSLAFPVLIPDATVTLDRSSLILRGTVARASAPSAASGNHSTLRAQVVFTQPLAPASTAATPDTPGAAAIPTLSLAFDHLDAATVESAFAPSSAPSGLFAAIASRVHPASPLPPLHLAVTAATCALDSLNPDHSTPARLALTRCSAQLHRAASDPPRAFTLDSFHAAFAGGSLAASGLIDGSDDTQRFRLHLTAEKLQPKPLAALVAAHWTGGSISATADLATQGATPPQWLAASTGTLQFDWTRGSLGPATAPGNTAIVFDRWTGSATWSASRLSLKANTLTRRGKSTSLIGFIPYGGPPHLSLSHP